MSGFRTAASFLTRVPLHPSGEVDLAMATPWFPVVGAVIGAFGGGVFAAASEVVPAGVAAALALAATALVTGAFHHDGLADVADAFGGGWDREQRLEIMKDPRHGTYGVVALVVSFAVQFAALGSSSAAWAFAALVAAHTLGRAAILVVLLTARPARPGLGADHSAGLRRGAVVAGVVAGAAIATAVLGWWSGLAVVAVAATTAVVVVLARRKIGGYTGDVLGAIEQVSEGAVLVVVAGVAGAGHLPWWR